MACREQKDTNNGNAGSLDATNFFKKEGLTKVEEAKAVADALKSEQIQLTKTTYDDATGVDLPNITLKISDKVVSVGKRLIVVDRGLFGPLQKQRVKGIDIKTDGTEIRDPFRIFDGSYWSLDDSERNLVYLKGTVDRYFDIVDFNYKNAGHTKAAPAPERDTSRTLAKRGVKTAGEEQKFIEGDLNPAIYDDTMEEQRQAFYGTEQWVLVRANKNKFLVESTVSEPTSNTAPKNSSIAGIAAYGTSKPTVNVEPEDLVRLIYSQNKWEVFIDGGVHEDETMRPATVNKNVEYFDHSYDLAVPLTPKELNGYSVLNSPSVGSVDFVYNFYIDDYEKHILNVDEAYLPNLYILGQELANEGREKDNVNLITLGGTLQMKDAGFMAAGSFSARREIDKFYFKKVAKGYKSATDNDLTFEQVLRKPRQKYSEIAITLDNMGILDEFENKKKLFPMYSEIEFSTDKITLFHKIMKDAKLDVPIIQEVMRGTLGYKTTEELPLMEATEYLIQTKNELGSLETKKAFSIDKTMRRAWNITTILEEVGKEPDLPETGFIAFGSVGDIGTFLGKRENKDLYKTPQGKFFKSLLKLIFQGKLRRLIKEKFRTYEEMLNGKPAYSDTVMYRVEKWITKSNGATVGSPIQNFYFPNTSELDVIKYVDTQMEYDKGYLYRVYAYQAVIGTKYAYRDSVIRGELAAFKVLQIPSIMMIETPYFEMGGKVIDDLPVFPDVEFVPYRAVNDNIMIRLNSNSGDYDLMPITIEPADEKKIENYRRARNLDEDDPVRYKTDDHAEVYQIYRLDKRPDSYKDFQENMLVSLETDVSSITDQKATSTSFIDEIKPNQKYYYTSRIIDNHQNIGYPSPVYEVEMVDDGGTIYPVINVIDINEKMEPKKQTKSGKKYIQIKPSLLQAMVNEEKSGIEELTSAKDVKNVMLGMRKESVWNKNWKIRLTSKKTGKRIDINLNLKTNQINVIQDDASVVKN